MNNNLRISDSEWEVMKAIWINKNCTANEVINNLNGYKKWSPRTVKTLIGRLQKKKIIGYKPDGRTYRYFALVEEKDCVKEESISFLKRIYNGSLKSMVANFIEEDYLSDKEIEELKNILDERKK